MKHLSLYIAVLVFSVLLVIATSLYGNGRSTKTDAAVNNTVRFDTTAISRVSNLSLQEAFPWVAVDANNISHVVWVYRAADRQFQLMYTNNIGGTFKAPKVVEELLNVAEDSRPIIVYANNALHLFYTIDEKRLIYRRGSLDGTWGTGLTVTTATGAGHVYNGGMAVEPGGLVHMMYIDDKCGTYNVFHKQYDGGALSAETAPMNECVYKNKPRAVYAGGRLHVVFRRDTDMYYASMVGNSWTGAINLANSPATVSHNPTITANGSSVYIAWGEGVNGHDVVMRYSSDSGQTWSGLLAVSNTGPGFSQLPSIAWASSINRGYIVWSDVANGTGGKTDIMFHEFDTAPTDFNNPVKLTCMAEASDWPVIAAGPGRAQVVWQDRNAGGQLQIFTIGGQIGAGQTTAGCGVAPTAGNAPPPPPAPTATPTPVGGVPLPPPGGGAPSNTPTPFPTITPLLGTPTPYIPTDLPNMGYGLKQFDDKDDSGQLLLIAIIVGLLFYTIAHALF